MTIVYQTQNATCYRHWAPLPYISNVNYSKKHRTTKETFRLAPILATSVLCNETDHDVHEMHFFFFHHLSGQIISGASLSMFYNPQPHIKSSSQMLAVLKIDFFRHFYCLSNKNRIIGESAAPSIHNASKIVYCNVSVRWAPCEWDYEQAPDNLEKKSVSCVSLFTAALQLK